MREIELAVAVLTLSATGAQGHDWYPIECCHGLDCAPVERVEPKADAALVVTSKHGTTVVPGAFPKRDSKDERMHICMRRDFENNEVMRPICLFLPPGS